MTWKKTKLQRNEVVSSNLYTKENKKKENTGLHDWADANTWKVKCKMKAINWIIGAKPNNFPSIKLLLHLKVILDLDYSEWFDKIIH